MGSVYGKDKILGVEIEQKYTGYVQYGDKKISNDKEDEIIDKYFGKPKIIKEDD